MSSRKPSTMDGVPAAQESRESHHVYPFTLGGGTVGGVVSIPTSVAGDGLLTLVLLPVATATTL